MLSACPTRTYVATRIDDSLSVAIGRTGHRAARVHSVFRSAVNLTVAGKLVTIGLDDAGGMPDGVLVAGHHDFRADGVRAGMSAEIHVSAIHIAEAGLVIHLHAAHPWSARIPVRDGRRWPRRSPVAHALADRDARATDVAGARIGLMAIPVARARLGEVSWAIVRIDPRAAADAARPLIGLGPGLTPSGDDALAGIEAALHALGHPAAGFLERVLDDVTERTTDVSAALLRHAARGEFTERIHRLLAALLDEGDETLPSAVERAAAWGATSGRDGLIGVLAGLDAATTDLRVVA